MERSKRACSLALASEAETGSTLLGQRKRQAFFVESEILQRQPSRDGAFRRSRGRHDVLFARQNHWNRETASPPASARGSDHPAHRPSMSCVILWNVGDEVRCRGNRLVTVIFTIGFDDLRHVSLTLVRVVARVRVGRIADGIARHILWISNRGARCVTIAIIINDLELIAQNPLLGKSALPPPCHGIGLGDP